MNYFQYGEKEIKYLQKKDNKLGIAIDRIGMIKRKTNPELFSALLSTIISQQISTKAAITINDRLLNLAGTFTAENINRLALDQVQQCGMSFK